jgi:hypothetical protein
MNSITITFIAPQVPCVSIIADTDEEEKKMIAIAQKMLKAIEEGNDE